MTERDILLSVADLPAHTFTVAGRCPTCDTAVPAGWPGGVMNTGHIVCSASCIAKAVDAMEEEQDEIDDLESEIEELEEKVSDLKEQNRSLRKEILKLKAASK